MGTGVSLGRVRAPVVVRLVRLGTLIYLSSLFTVIHLIMLIIVSFAIKIAVGSPATCLHRLASDYYPLFWWLK